MLLSRLRIVSSTLQRLSPVLNTLRSNCKPLSASSSMAANKAKLLPDGTYPTMITPFLDDEKRSIDWDGVDLLTEWYIRSGVDGIFSVCLSSEMFQLTNEERISLARRVKERSEGRVPVVVGATFEGGLEEQAKLMNAMGEFADSVVIITNQIATMEESDEVWMANCQKLMDMTGDLPLGLYETPVPKARNLTPPMVRWIAESGRFNFLKDTSLAVSTLHEKIQAAKDVQGTPLKVFTAKTQFINDCLEGGGNGFSGVLPNFFPWLNTWLCRHQDDKSGREKVQKFVSLADRVIAHKYPTSSKYYLNKFYSVPIHPVSRIHWDVSFSDQDTKALSHLKESMEELCTEMDITIVNPKAVQSYLHVMKQE